MSSLPGFTLEDFLMWEFDLVVAGKDDANVSLGLAEMLANTPPRQRVTGEQFGEIVEMFSDYREDMEYLLEDFDEETQSWRSYASVVEDCAPDYLYSAARKRIESYV